MTIYVKKMTINEIKIYLMNTLGFLSIQLDIDHFLKWVLVAVSILYTLAKTVSIYQNEIKNPKK